METQRAPQVQPQQAPQQQQQQAKKEKMRSIGRWYIGETLGKGGYSWVKKGYDKKTGKAVALKFMAKADKSWADEQTKQVITEIEALKQIRDPHVMKLYAYNLNAKYPTKNREKLDAILLVLEFAPMGELFDILYYTSALEEDVARTYFRQLVLGLEACHNAGIAHRDIKPQNLLLDARFNLKITDFGLSKVFESDADTIMKTTYVGTRGYQAPELLLNKPYDLACDVFSAGVVLFILLTGYPPFEQATKKDRWFNPLVTGDYARFWKLHRGCHISNNEKVKRIIQRMLTFDPKQRATLSELKQDDWYLGKVLEGKELVNVLRARHRKMEQKRQQDARKLSDLQHSITRRHLEDIEKEIGAPTHQPPLFPAEEVEGIFDIHTTADWKTVFATLKDVVASRGGHPEFNTQEARLTATTKFQNAADQTCIVKFEVQAWRSREHQNPDPTSQETVLVVRTRRLEGLVLDYRNVVKTLVHQSCAHVLTGLPQWALQKDVDVLNDVDVDELANDYDTCGQALFDDAEWEQYEVAAN